MTDLTAFTPASPLMLVGCGNMGRALVRGWLTAGLDPAGLVIIDPALDPEDVPEFAGATIVARAADVASGMVSSGASSQTASSAIIAAPAARLMLLAVKPQVMNDVLAAVAPLAETGTIAVSVAAGVTLEQLDRGLSGEEKPSLVRAMPNTPAAVGAGVTGLVAAAGVPVEDRTLADLVMRAAGKTVWVADENLMDAVTATSGSGPAYVFHLVEALANAAEAAGLPAEDAMVLARQTVVGAARLLAVEDDVPAADLRVRVTSPGGTTAAALDVLMQPGSGLTELMTRAVAAATKRGQELAD